MATDTDLTDSVKHIGARAVLKHSDQAPEAPPKDGVEVKNKMLLEKQASRDDSTYTGASPLGPGFLCSSALPFHWPVSPLFRPIPLQARRCSNLTRSWTNASVLPSL